MSDWAAKLLRKPSKVQTEAAAPKGEAEKLGTKQKNPPKTLEPARRDTEPKELFNNSEVLSFLHARYEHDLVEAHNKEETVVYRSLESASAWNTSSAGKKNDDEGFNLLRELNLASLRPRKP